MNYLQAACTQVRQIVTTIPDRVEETFGPATADMLRQAAHYVAPTMGYVAIDTVLNGVGLSVIVSFGTAFISLFTYAAICDKLAYLKSLNGANPQSGVLKLVDDFVSYREVFEERLQNFDAMRLIEHASLNIVGPFIANRVDAFMANRAGPFVFPVRPEFDQMPM